MRGTYGYSAFKTVRPAEKPAELVDALYSRSTSSPSASTMAGPTLTPETFEAGLRAYPGGTGPVWARGSSPLGGSHPPRTPDNRLGERVIAIAGHHVARSVDLDVLGVRHRRQELGNRLAADHVAETPADDQGRHGDAPLGTFEYLV